MSMRTGQASKQAPHNEEAYGSDGLGIYRVLVDPAQLGVSTAPIGPG